MLHDYKYDNDLTSYVCSKDQMINKIGLTLFNPNVKTALEQIGFYYPDIEVDIGGIFKVGLDIPEINSKEFISSNLCNITKSIPKQCAARNSKMFWNINDGTIDLEYEISENVGFGNIEMKVSGTILKNVRKENIDEEFFKMLNEIDFSKQIVQSVWVNTTEIGVVEFTNRRIRLTTEEDYQKFYEDYVLPKELIEQNDGKFGAGESGDSGLHLQCVQQNDVLRDQEQYTDLEGVLQEQEG